MSTHPSNCARCMRFVQANMCRFDKLILDFYPNVAPSQRSTLTSSSPRAAIPHVARRYRPAAAAAASLLPRPERAAPASASNVRAASPTTCRLASPTTSSLHASAGQSPATTWHAAATAERNRIPERDTDCQSSSRPSASRLPSLRTKSHDQRPIRDWQHHAVSYLLRWWEDVATQCANNALVPGPVSSAAVSV